MGRYNAAVILWLITALLAVPQDAAPKPIETAHLRVATSTSAAAGPAKQQLSLHVDVTPKPGMHVYSPGQDGYIVVSLTLEATGPVAAIGKPKFPAGEKYLMPALNETQLVYSKPFRITQDVTMKEPASSETRTVKGTLRYQACDDRVCYLPKNVAVAWTLPNR